MLVSAAGKFAVLKIGHIHVMQRSQSRAIMCEGKAQRGKEGERAKRADGMV